MLKPRSLRHPLLESFFQGRIIDASTALRSERTTAKPCGWGKRELAQWLGRGGTDSTQE